MATIQKLRKHARDIRHLLLTTAFKAKSGHIGSSLSTVDIIAALYFGFMQINHKKPKDPARDIFILSKGHGCLGYYAALAIKGYFPKALLFKLFNDNTLLSAHPTINTVAGIEFSTGSLGHGLSVGAGMAYGFQFEKKTNKVVVMLSDGECDEGSVWEAAMAAAHLKLNNLIAIIDYNKTQAFGKTKDVMNLEPLAKKWDSFGWQVVEIDGHDFKHIRQAFSSASKSQNKPTVIIAHTIKGKGVDFMEDTIEWHYLNLDEDKYKRAIQQLK
jgi:transketolase